MEDCKPKFNIIVSSLISIGISMAVTMILLLLVALISLKGDMPTGLNDFLIILSLCVGGFLSGYINSRQQRKKGLIYGVMTGGAAAVLLLICSLGCENASLGLMTITKVLLLVAMGGVGGICGVNKKQKRIKF